MLRYLDEKWIISMYCLSDTKHKNGWKYPDIWCHRNKTISWHLNCSSFNGVFWQHKDGSQITFFSSGFELWFQFSIIFQINLRMFAKPGLCLNEKAHLRSPVAAHLFWDSHFSSNYSNLTSSRVYSSLSLSLSLPQTHTCTHKRIHTQKPSHSVSI